MNRSLVLTVKLDASDDSIVATHRAALAGLPDRWRISTAKTDAAVVYGGHTDWPARAGAELAAGVHGVLVTHPVWTTRAAVETLAAQAATAGARIAVESGYLADPSWKTFLPTLREHATDVVLVDSLRTIRTATTATSDGHDLRGHWLEQLALLQTVVGPLTEVTFSEEAAEHYATVGESAGRVLNVVGVRGGAAPGHLTLDLIGLARRWRVRFIDGAIARPTTVEMMDTSGVQAAPAIYETGRRGTWLELHEAITNNEPVSYDLGLFGESLRLLTSSAEEEDPISAPGVVS
jgi:hypothetical protein